VEIGALNDLFINTSVYAHGGASGVVSDGAACAVRPTSSITTALPTPRHTDLTGQSLTALSVLHAQATVTTTVNPIPSGSSVPFRQFLTNSTCATTTG
jgi:hypothetical protein